MAHLLLMYQYLRAKREYNQLSAKSIRSASKKTRVHKNIERVQKRYTSQIERIRSQAKMAQSNFNNWILNMYGLGSMQQNLNIFNYQGAGGMSQFQINSLQQLFAKGADIKNAEGNEEHIDGSRLKDIYEAKMNGILQPNYTDEGKTKVDDSNPYQINGNPVSALEMYCLTQAMNRISMNETQVRQQVGMMNQQYQTNVSIWEEAMVAQLEAEQDAALEPLNYEETMWDLEDTTIKADLETKKAEMESLKTELSEQIKEDVPKFGLS